MHWSSLKTFEVGVHCVYPPRGIDAHIWNMILYGQWSWNNSFIIGRGTGFNTEMYNWNVHGRWEIEIIVTIFTVIVHPKPFIYTILLLPWVCCDSDEDGFFSRGILSHQQECKEVQRYNQQFSNMRLLSHNNQPHIICT